RRLRVRPRSCSVRRRQHTSDRSLHPRSAFHSLHKKPQGPPLIYVRHVIRTPAGAQWRRGGRVGGSTRHPCFVCFVRGCSHRSCPVFARPLPDLCPTAPFPLSFRVCDSKSGGVGNSPPLFSIFFERHG